MTDILRILIAPLVWLAAFSSIYGLHGIICAHDVAGGTFGGAQPRAILVGAYGFAILMQVALIIVLYSQRLTSRSGFVRFVSRATGWVGLVATVWSLLPVVVTTYCL